MAQINLTDEHTSLVSAAIGLGDWLCELPEMTKTDIALIKSIQRALSHLPTIKDDTLAMYGFSIERGDAEQGLVRGWDVSLEYFANDAEQQGGLEIFSSYIPMPETDNKVVLEQKKNSEVYFNWPIGETCSFISAQHQKQWIDDISEPLQHAKPSDRLRVELVFADQYSEIDCKIE